MAGFKAKTLAVKAMLARKELAKEAQQQQLFVAVGTGRQRRVIRKNPHLVDVCVAGHGLRECVIQGVQVTKDAVSSDDPEVVLSTYSNLKVANERR